MAVHVRRLTRDDSTAAWTLLRHAFGMQETEAPPGWLERPGRNDWGAFDDGGRLVAKATDREQAHWFGGRLVPASGIAGMAVAPEQRGTGFGRVVLTRLLEHARERGAAIATLFRTGPEFYRRLGCEEVGAQMWTAVPVSALAAVPRPSGMTLRRAGWEDASAVVDVYVRLARASSGLLDRAPPLLDLAPDAVLAARDGITLAVDADG